MGRDVISGNVGVLASIFWEICQGLVIKGPFRVPSVPTSCCWDFPQCSRCRALPGMGVLGIFLLPNLGGYLWFQSPSQELALGPLVVSFTVCLGGLPPI